MTEAAKERPGGSRGPPYTWPKPRRKDWIEYMIEDRRGGRFDTNEIAIVGKLLCM